ncbi:unnamed protein product [Spirodela intermedia]|uniref:Uncharacterized protein n=2 Tax=Spirodela intermedia TaxID=51605 RepID=A0A7I8IN78_SPIIN|nr:unnamed protein product [Spirodela intermedia]CAA6659268.1 unnamed protein product [Spirodela intermedia]CAA7395577.1 unnamed protein product [Spirodela intermedia]
MIIGDGCPALFTTQASTKVYKSTGSECSVQGGSLLAVVPHPVTCFSTARYSQSQVFRISSDSNLLVVDWFTSGRRESGEWWDFGPYKSRLLEQGGGTSSIAERMQAYQVIAMVVLIGPKLRHIQGQLQEDMKKLMSRCIRKSSHAGGPYSNPRAKYVPEKPPLIASCSSFVPKVVRVVVRKAALTTDSVYEFLRLHLADMEPLLGAPIYG